MIELTQQQITALLELAQRAPKSAAEQYAIDIIVKIANQQLAAAKQSAGE